MMRRKTRRRLEEEERRVADADRVWARENNVRITWELIGPTSGWKFVAKGDGELGIAERLPDAVRDLRETISRRDDANRQAAEYLGADTRGES